MSNFDLATLTELCKVAEIKPVCNQARHPACDIAVLAFLWACSLPSLRLSQVELHPQLAQRKLVGQSLRLVRLGLTAVLVSFGIYWLRCSEHLAVARTPLQSKMSCGAIQVLGSWLTARALCRACSAWRTLRWAS